MKQVVLKVGGMSCSACSSHIEKYLKEQKGVVDASVNLVMGQAFITYQNDMTVSDLEQYIRDSGYESLGVYDPLQEENEKISIFPFFFYACLLGILMIFSMIFKNPVFSFFLVLPFLYFGRDIFKHGIQNLLRKSPNMDSLVTLGVFSSFLFSVFELFFFLFGKEDLSFYFESCAMIIYFVKLGRFLDGRSREKTKEALKELVQVTPSKALLKTKDGELEITIDEVKKGDLLIVKPGMKVAVDGIVKKGSSHVDDSFITGESIPVKKKISDQVVAGSLNLDGYLEYCAEKIGRDSTVSEIVRLVVQATNTKTPISKIADQISFYFVPSLFLLSFFTFLFYLFVGFSYIEAFTTFVTMLVVACPCALGLATPLAIVVGTFQCTKEGILIRKSDVLEGANKIDTIVFDKTGTLTYGTLKVANFYNFSSYTKEEILAKVSALESYSTHPIASAFKETAKKVAVQDFSNIPGIGISGTIDGKSLFVGNQKLFSKLGIKNDYQEQEKELGASLCSFVYVVEDHQVLALIGVRDIVRKDAKRTIAKLQSMGHEIIMLTGDNKETATFIAHDLGISKVISEVLPKEKVEVIRSLQKEGKHVMMVGDGMNDAPSLAHAEIGVSFQHGTDVATNSSLVVLFSSSLWKLITFFSISKLTFQTMKQNLFWAFFYNAIMILLAMGVLKPFGISINPMIASLSMTFSSLTVVGNTLRLKRRNYEKV